MSSCRLICLNDLVQKVAAGAYGICSDKRGVQPVLSNVTTNARAGAILRMESATTIPPPAGSDRKRCLRCGQMYTRGEDSPTSCSYHGHLTGDLGMFSLAPPHQGIDGEWTEDSGIIVYRWNDEKDRPNTGPRNWKRRWSCCGVYDEHAIPCRKGPHVSYDDGFTLY